MITCRWTSILQLSKCSVNNSLLKWDITHDSNGNFFMRSLFSQLWFGAKITVCGASSVAIDPSRWQVLLVSLIPTYLQAKRCKHHLSYYFFSLTTDMNRFCQNPRVPAAQRVDYGGSGVRVHFIICFSSPV